MEGVAATGVGERAKGSKMADLEDVTLDGRPLHSLRVADLKAALEQRGLAKSGQKNALIKRLKGALMLENLQRTSTAHIGLQPNSQIGEEMSQNSFIKQYLAKQQELLRQRLEREAREAAEADDMDSPVGPDQEDHAEANDGTSCPQSDQEVSPVVGLQNKRHPFDKREEKEEGERGWGRTDKMGEEDGAGETEEAAAMLPNTRKAPFRQGQAMQAAGDASAAEAEPQDVPGSRARRSSTRQSHDDPAPSSPSAPPRAVASLSVRVVGDPERQGPPQLRSDPPVTAHSALQPSLPPPQRAPRSQLDSDEDSDDDEEEDDEEEEEDWGAGHRRGGSWEPPSSLAARERSRRAQQPSQHIPLQLPPHQPHPHSHPQLPLRQPTPPPSPPPELSFPLPETPKQSPPSLDEPEGVAGAGAGLGVAVRRHPPEGGRSPPSLQRQDSSSSSGSSSSNSRSSSPEPHGGAGERKPGPLTLLARKMESEGAFAGSRKKGRAESEEQELAATATSTADGLAATLFPGALLREGGVTTIAHTGVSVLAPPTSGTTLMGNKASAAVPTITFSAAVTAGHQGARGAHFPAFSPTSTPARVVMATAEDSERDGVKMEAEDVDPPKADNREARDMQHGEPALHTPVPAALLQEVPLPSGHPLAAVSFLRFRHPRSLRGPAPSPTPPPPEAPPLLSSPSRPGLGEEGASGGESAIVPGGDQREGVLQTGSLPATGGESALTATPKPTGHSGPARPVGTSAETRAPAGASQRGHGEAEKPGQEASGAVSGQADGGRPQEERSRKPTAAEADRGLSRAVMGPVLPPSPPPEENEAERDRDRERRSSPSSDSSSSDSDSASSSSHSSGSSSSSSEDKSHTVSRSRRSASDQRDSEEGSPAATPCKRRGAHLDKGGSAANEGESHSKRPCLGRGQEQEEEKREEMGGADERQRSVREVKQAAMSESPGPECDQAPESSEGRAEESTTPKAFTARKISLTTVTKPSPGTPARRWGSSTAVNAKKPSISITTDSLKSLIPDVKLAAGPGGQEAVVDLHPEEGRLSEDEEGAERGEGGDAGQGQGPEDPPHRHAGRPRREPGERPRKNRRERMRKRRRKRRVEAETERVNKEDKNSSGGGGSLEVAMEVQTPSASREPAEIRRVHHHRRPRSAPPGNPPPPRGKITNIVHVCNLVRPFTLGQLKELLNRTGTVVEEGFWIDKIKSHCYVTYSSTEEAVATRAALHGVKWPQSNPKFLSVDFCEQDELDFHRGLLTAERPGEEDRGATGGGPGGAPPALLPERERGPGAGVRDQWAQREREMERRERTRAEREWDRDKVRDFGKPGDEREGAARRSRSRDRERRRKERGKSKERKADKKEKAPEEPPAKLLDDLFCKTKAAPCIYWLPLTEQQALQREAERAERMKEREKRRKELQEEEDKKREEERRERAKGREKEASVAGGGGGGTSAAAAGGGGARGGDGERERDRERDRDRERERERGRDRDGDKRREGGYRRPVGQGGGQAFTQSQ
ncbi:hypothetical protein SKAU_G00377520 [Synaphobranchus kaupii]|uniref:SAP domain-containing protein n=1 Tax=Synaphobranchus kaupii TaxID=118154 RepID=A0A9Q1ED10_SYNKA|nr:hypothetical protein SKAU_G00377520 [Synaphobranchus kaupii]